MATADCSKPMKMFPVGRSEFVPPLNLTVYSVMKRLHATEVDVVKLLFFFDMKSEFEEVVI